MRFSFIVVLLEIVSSQTTTNLNGGSLNNTAAPATPNNGKIAGSTHGASPALNSTTGLPITPGAAPGTTAPGVTPLANKGADDPSSISPLGSTAGTNSTASPSPPGLGSSNSPLPDMSSPSNNMGGGSKLMPSMNAMPSGGSSPRSASSQLSSKFAGMSSDANIASWSFLGQALVLAYSLL